MSRTRPPGAREDEPANRGGSAVRATGCASVGGCLLIVVVCGGTFFGWSQMKQKALDDLVAADRLHTEGKKGEAVAKYKTAFSFAPADRKIEIIKRISDYEAVAGDKAEARRWVEKGLDGKMEIGYESPAARDVLAQAQRERVEAEAKKKEAEDKKKAEREAKDQAKRAEKEMKGRYGSYPEAMSQAEKVIRKNLPFPNEAQFRALGQPVVQNPDGSWQVSGSVVTKDASGGGVTYQFRGTMMRSVDGSWQSVGDIFLDPQ